MVYSLQIDEMQMMTQSDRPPEDSVGSTPSQLWRRHRPEHFSTYAPRELIRRLKVIAAIRDVPLWAIVTEALESYLSRFESEHGALPKLADSGRGKSARGG